ncbi:hypothetical protein [Streptomyces sp. NBC_00198]|uniref:hypothetical protein n=1 Tax=Streptomyces sp. NBC_00198 TaxID=2975677 RepID=UPI00225A428C|nr:hypothetical protein [Streptomyces sp. NBC_00198]MCX5285684.1 hypothetical protein [Streptomyces sp. NBC_00198]MCX5286214.1 hypothetical protein [Streptomyces sp. NBC_00198]
MRQRPRPAWLMPGLAPRCPVHSGRPFRVLLCRAHPGSTPCSLRWVAHRAEAFAAHEQQRAAHEALCSSGLYAAAGL